MRANGNATRAQAHHRNCYAVYYEHNSNAHRHTQSSNTHKHANNRAMHPTGPDIHFARTLNNVRGALPHTGAPIIDPSHPQRQARAR